jgi:hypothetical protein
MSRREPSHLLHDAPKRHGGVHSSYTFTYTFLQVEIYNNADLLWKRACDAVWKGKETSSARTHRKAGKKTDQPAIEFREPP